MNAPTVTPAPLQLVLGEEELLVERAVRAAFDSARLADPVADLTRVRVADLTPPELAELVSPSLFAEGRVIVLEGAHDAGTDIAAAVKSAGATVAECVKITKPAEREAFVRNEIRRAGGKSDGEAVVALIDAVGSDLRELASAAAQLVADTGGAVTKDAVRRYHRGR